MGSLKDYKFWLNLFLGKEKDFSYKEYLLSSFGVLGSKIKTFLKIISGTILSFDDGVAKPAVNLIAHFEPVQEGSGDPSPENVRPIHGWTECEIQRTGVNIWDEEWEIGDIDGITGIYKAGGYIRSKNLIKVLPNTTYYFYNSKGMTIYTYDENRNPVLIRNNKYCFWPINTSQTYTFDSRVHFIAFRNNVLDYSQTYNHDMSINYPATDTEYHAYQGHTYPIIFPISTGEVFGGYVDVTLGKVQKTLHSIDLGTLDWTAYDTQSNAYWANVPLPTINGNNGTPIKLYCSALLAETLTKTIGYITGSMPVNSIAVRAGVATRLFVKSDAGSASAVKESLNGVIAVYELATPIEYDITPTAIELLKGYNNVWNSAGGNNELTYIGTKKGN